MAGYYIRETLAGRAKPHVFSWFIWGLSTLLIAWGQYEAGAGWGASIAFLGAILCFLRAAFAIKRGVRTITRSDLTSLIVCLLAIAAWFILKTPLWSIAMLTIVDLVAFYPTVRKSWHDPYNEPVSNHFYVAALCVVALISIEDANVATLLYPLALFTSSMLYSIFLVYQRTRIMRQNKV